MTSKTHTVLKTGRNEITKIILNQITYIIADGNYTTIILNDGKKLTICKSLSKVLDKDIPTSNFIKIKRGLVVNKASITKLKSGQIPVVILNNNIELNASRRMFKELKKQFPYL